VAVVAEDIRAVHQTEAQAIQAVQAVVVVVVMVV
jgi:hypothetical protein